MTDSPSTTCADGGGRVDLVLDVILELRAVTLAECPRCGEVSATLKPASATV